MIPVVSLPKGTKLTLPIIGLVLVAFFSYDALLGGSFFRLLSGIGPDHTCILRVEKWYSNYRLLSEQARSLRVQGRLSEAESVMGQALALIEGHDDFIGQLAEDQMFMAELIEEQSRDVEAEKYWREAKHNCEQSGEYFSLPLSNARASLGNNLYRQERKSEAKAELLEGIIGLRKAEDTSDLFAKACINLSDIHLGETDLVQARSLAEEALTVEETNHGGHTCDHVAQAKHALANVYATAGHSMKAVMLYEECVPLMIANNSANKIAAITNAGMAYTDMHDFPRAIASMQLAARLHSNNCIRRDAHDIYIQMCTVHVYMVSKQYRQAKSIIDSCMPAMKATNDPYLAQALSDLRVIKSQNRHSVTH